MKLDDVTLQNILKAYGNNLKATKPKQKITKEELQTFQQNNPTKKLDSEDLELINYNKDGKTAVTQKKKDALVDFFQ